MRTLLLAAAAVICLFTLSPAVAGGGNGPNFPGYQGVDVSQVVNADGHTTTVTTVTHAANASFQNSPTQNTAVSGSYARRLLSSMSLQRGG